jgi:predicted nucleic acid-binding protein
VFDTNVATQAARSREQKDRFNSFIRARRGQVWLHATVWLELQVGARSEDEGVDVRRSSIHHDAIIAASTREHDFTIVTNNRADFELISPYLSKLSFAPPYP